MKEISTHFPLPNFKNSALSASSPWGCPQTSDNPLPRLIHLQIPLLLLQGHSELTVSSLSIFYISSSHEYNRMFFRSCLLFVFLCPKPIYLVLIGGGEASLSDSWRLKQITAPNGPHNKELYCAEWWPLSKWALKLAEGGISLAHLYTVTPVQYVVFHGEHPEPNLTFHKVQQELFWAEV